MHALDIPDQFSAIFSGEYFRCVHAIGVGICPRALECVAILNSYIMLLVVCVRTPWQSIIFFSFSCQIVLSVVCLRVILTLVVRA